MPTEPTYDPDEATPVFKDVATNDAFQQQIAKEEERVPAQWNNFDSNLYQPSRYLNESKQMNPNTGAKQTTSPNLKKFIGFN